MSDRDQKLELAIQTWVERGSHIQQPEIGTKYQLPLWGDLVRAIPNPFTRSSLFAPIARGRRKTHRRTLLASRSDIQIYYSGDQLDEADRDVFLELYHEGCRVPFQEKVFTTRGKLLRNMGRSKSASSYKWLDGALERLFMGALFVRVDNKNTKYTIGKSPKTPEEWIHLINIERVENSGNETDEICFSIDSRIMRMFLEDDFTLIDHRKRKLIDKRANMAKWLQCLVCSNRGGNNIQRYSLEDLMKWMSYESPIRKFREALREALTELKDLSIITDFELEISTRGKEQVRLTRPEISIEEMVK